MSIAILEMKKQVVEEIKQKIENSPSFVIIDYKGLTVAQDTEFRNTFRKSGVEYKVLKNRMVKRALNDLGFTEFDQHLEGPTAVAFASNDLVAPAKIAIEAVKKYAGKITIKCGMLEKTYLDVEGVKELALLPPKEQIVAKMLGTMQAPISNFVYVLNATISGLARCLNQIAERG